MTDSASETRLASTILIVDDDPNNLAVICDSLADCGFTILVAEDGESAVERAAFASPDLILLDIMMPGIDGYETCRQLKEQRETKNIPVIFMTALAETSHKVRGLEAGAVDYITKPFQREELLARISVHLQIRELTRQLQDAKDLLEKRVEERTIDLAIANQELEEEIAERQMAQEQLQEQAIVLEKNIEELQHAHNELKNKEQALRQSQKMEAIGTLAGGIAHDFNNILTAIIGYTEIAQRKAKENDELSWNLARVQEASFRARDLVSRILLYSRQGEQERKPVSMSAIITEVLSLLRSSLPTTIEIQRHNKLQANDDKIMADPTQLHQVLMNLATNAAHAMRDHGGVLGISVGTVTVDDSMLALHPELSPGSYISLKLSDTGHGMNEKTKERIFDPYFTTKKVGEGTGMGLSVVQGIVRGHSGIITVDSKPGEGTSFHILIPKISGETADQHEANRDVSGGTERILFVDDEEMLVDVGESILSMLGYSVTTTMSSLEALELFRSAPESFDLIITDLTMPGLTGIELAKELLAIRRNIPIILCTGFSEHINKKRSMNDGIANYIMKPYDTGSIDRVIREVLDRSDI